jgi:hypothetical protein
MGQFFQLILTSPKLFSHEIGAYGENRLNGSKVRALLGNSYLVWTVSLVDFITIVDGR